GSRERNGIIKAAADRGGDGGGVLVALRDGQGRGRRRNGEILACADDSQGDGSILLHPAAIAGHGDGIRPCGCAAAHRDGHGGVTRTRCWNRVGTEAHAGTGRRPGVGERDGTVEAATEGGSNGRSSLITLLNRE